MNPRRKTKVSAERAPTHNAETLSEARWAEFAARMWERSADVVPGALSEPLASPATLFEALVRAGRQWRLGDTSARFSFWVDAQETKGFAELLPLEEDVDFEGYEARVRRRLRGAEFTLLLADPHLYHDALWNRVRVFMRGMYPHVGLPCGGVDTGIFLGRYRRTPFGVHRGQMSVLTFPAHGTKHFRLWPRGYGEAHADIQDRREYPEHLAASFELTAAPGDVLYWPADYWHIAEGTGDFTAALNVGMWWEKPPLSRVLFEMSQRLSEEVETDAEERISLSYREAHSGALSEWMPAEVSESLAVTRAAVSSERLDEALALEALRALSADGFRDVPKPSPPAADFTSETRLERVPECRILTAAGSDGALYVASNGYLFNTADGVRQRSLIKTLQTGEPFALDAALKTNGAAELISWLLATRSIRVISNGGGARRRA